MPRKARILVPNYPHHIVQRGHNRKVVFLDEDHQFYLENLKEWTVTLGIKIYAWCLMTNHIHLIVEPGDDAVTVSELMKSRPTGGLC